MRCPKCTSENPDNSRFCRNCGEKLVFTSYPGQEVQGERKVITVLFTDVVDYTVISEKIDSELIKEIMDGCFHILIAQVQKFGGTVDKLLGDGLMALFGAPIAYEDHAQRACYAALGMQEAVSKFSKIIHSKYGIDFKMRTGLNSGPVTVGLIGTDQKTSYTAIGDTVNCASRMEAASAPAAVLVSSSTYNLVKDFFEFQPVGEVPLKGRELPVSAFRLIAARKVETRFDVAVTKGLSRFVGREQEIDTLKTAFLAASRGNSRAIGIRGEPGIGKSRLLLEFLRSLDSQSFSYFEGRCTYYGGVTPFRPLIDIIKVYFNIVETDNEVVIKDKVLSKCTSLDTGFVEYSPFFEEILSVKVEDQRFLRMENQFRRAKLFEGVIKILSKESVSRTIVIAIEDLHWIDKASEEFLSYFIDHLSRGRILLLLLYRVEYIPLWQKRTDYTESNLEEVSSSASTDLLKSLLPEGDPDTKLQELVLSKTGGNPLFVEELVHSLFEDGTIRKDDNHYSLNSFPITIRVPDTINGLIAARIDRLPDEIKNTLQVAAVIGREFSNQVLHAVIGRTTRIETQLETLRQLDFISNNSQGSVNEYSFKHALIQDVAYASLLQAKRKAFHETIGQAIETLYPQKLEEYSEILAYHFKQAGLVDRAIHYLVKAGKRSHERYACEEAHVFFKEAVDLLTGKPYQIPSYISLLIDILIEWSIVFYYRGDWKGLMAVLTSYEKLAEASTDKRQKAWFFGWLGYSMFSRGRIKESCNYLKRALSFAEENGDRKAIAYLNCWLLYPHYDLGLLDIAAAYGDKALAMCDSGEGDDYVYTKTLFGFVFIWLYGGNIQQSIKTGETVIQYSKTHGNIRGLFTGYALLAMTYMAAGEWSKMLYYADLAEGLNIDRVYIAVSRFFRSAGFIMIGRMEEAEINLKQYFEHNRKYGLEVFENPANGFWGLLLIMKGHMTEGYRMLRKAAEKCRQEESLYFAGVMEMCQAQVYAKIAAGDSRIKPALIIKNISFLLKVAPFAGLKAINHFNKAKLILEQLGTNSTLGSIYLEMARYYQRKGNHAHAKMNLEEAVRIFKKTEATGYLREAEKLATGV